MITRRDLVVAALTAVLTLSVVVFAQSQEQVMNSTTFDWEKVPTTTTRTGAVRRFFRTPTATLDELSCHVTTLNPGESPHPPHHHPDEELIIVKEGQVESWLEGKTSRLGPGSVIFQAANQQHSIKNVGAAPATYFVIKWNSPGMLRKKASE